MDSHVISWFQLPHKMTRHYDDRVFFTVTVPKPDRTRWRAQVGMGLTSHIFHRLTSDSGCTIFIHSFFFFKAQCNSSPFITSVFVNPRSLLEHGLQDRNQQVRTSPHVSWDSKIILELSAWLLRVFVDRARARLYGTCPWSDSDSAVVPHLPCDTFTEKWTEAFFFSIVTNFIISASLPGGDHAMSRACACM